MGSPTSPSRSTPADPRPAAPNRGLVAWLDRVLYPQFGDNWDDELFRHRIEAKLREDARVLDLGAGAGLVKQMNFRGLVASVVGIDPDERVKSNPHLDEAYVASGAAIPLPDAHFDLVFSDNILEHLEEPDEVFVEVWRVLKPGGFFLVKTPNKWHYMPLLARATPHFFHRYMNRLRGRPALDTFPTRYRVNTAAALRQAAARTGFVVEDIALVEGRPEYLRLCSPTYLLGWLYERLVNTLPALEHFRILLLAALRKPHAPQSVHALREKLAAELAS